MRTALKKVCLVQRHARARARRYRFWPTWSCLRSIGPRVEPERGARSVPAGELDEPSPDEFVDGDADTCGSNAVSNHFERTRPVSIPEGTSKLVETMRCWGVPGQAEDRLIWVAFKRSVGRVSGIKKRAGRLIVIRTRG